jgi:chromosomal replication initiator protein
VIHPAWEDCLDRLQAELPATQFNIWIQPLRPNMEGKRLRLLAPNRYIRDWVAERYLNRIAELVREISAGELASVDLGVSEAPGPVTAATPAGLTDARKAEPQAIRRAPMPINTPGGLRHTNVLETQYTFDNFVEGKSNALALAASRQVVENPGGAYNPLYIYGGVGLGKTHLMHAIGNALIASNPDAKVLYLRSEQFVSYMVKAIELGAMADFQKYFRSQDVLLIDDIQFLAKKDRSQEEFFHTFNALFEGGQQMIFTCDRYPREISGLEERLKSRFGWGLPVAVEPPELETRAAILMRKAAQAGVELPQDSALFMAQKIRANVRELEGALTRVIASARFTHRPLDVGLVRESLKDLLAVHDRMISMDNIQRTVAEYYKIRVADLSSKRRNRSIARPRQVAMALAKELTNHSLPEIGDSFGGRDHTTVLHACRKVEELKETTSEIREDYNNLLRLLTT